MGGTRRMVPAERGHNLKQDSVAGWRRKIVTVAHLFLELSPQLVENRRIRERRLTETQIAVHEISDPVVRQIEDNLAGAGGTERLGVRHAGRTIHNEAAPIGALLFSNDFLIA